MTARRVFVIAALGGALAAFTWIAAGGAPEPRVAEAVPLPHPGAMSPVASGTRAAPERPASAPFERWVQARSSLRGADLDGAWDVDARGQLHPTLALRRRFDQLLTLRGETSLDEIERYIETEVRELVGTEGAQHVLDA